MSLRLTLEGAGKRFRGGEKDGVWALRHISAAVGPGVTAVIGPNGAGKTTLLRMAAGIMGPSEGSVRLGCLDSSADGLAYRDAVGYLPQQPGFYEEMTSLSFLLYMCGLKLIPRSLALQRCHHVLGAAGLSGVRGRRIRSLSHGARLRLGLAQALLNDPCLLVLDEPADQIDPEGRIQLFALLRRMGASRIVLFSTHSLDSLTGVADNVFYLCRGRLAFCGTIGEFLEPVHAPPPDGESTVIAAYRYWSPS